MRVVRVGASPAAQTDQIEGSADVHAGRLKAIVPVLGSCHFEHAFHMGEIDPSEVAFDDFHGPADQAACEGRGGGGELGGGEDLRLVVVVRGR